MTVRPFSFWRSLKSKGIQLLLGIGICISSGVIFFGTGKILIFSAKWPHRGIQEKLFFKNSWMYMLVNKDDLDDSLIRAVSKHENGFAKILLDQGASIKFENTQKTTPLCIAALKNNIEMAKELLHRGADINETDSKLHEYPLAFAVLENRLEMVDFLIKNGADVNRRTKYMEPPLQLAIEYHYNDVAKLLIEAGAKSDYRSVSMPNDGIKKISKAENSIVNRKTASRN